MVKVFERKYLYFREFFINGVDVEKISILK